MTDNNTSNTRSKLTLKIPSSSGSTDLGKKSQTNPVNKDNKHHSSAVHVTIKGRKKENGANNFNQTGLNKNELEARFKAISFSKNNKSDDYKTHDVLSKIKVSNNPSNKDNDREFFKKNPKNIQEENHQNIKEIDENTEHHINHNLIKNTQETSPNFPKEENVKSNIENNPPRIQSQNYKPNSYNPDSFDVRNKIKQSLAVSNQQKEEREKIVQERKKLEGENWLRKNYKKNKLKKIAKN